MFDALFIGWARILFGSEIVFSGRVYNFGILTLLMFWSFIVVKEIPLEDV